MPEIQNKHPDSILAISFSSLLGLFFKVAIRAFRDFTSFLVKYKIMVVAAIVIGIGTGIVVYKVSPVFFKLTMVVRSSEMRNKSYGQMMNNLSILAETHSYEVLANRLKVSEAFARKIRSIKALDLDGADLSRDTSSTVENSFVIQMSIRDNEIADSLQKAIVDYFNTNPYLSKLKQTRIQIFNERLDFLNGELRRIDSISDAYTKSLLVTKGSLTFYNNEFNPADIFKQSGVYSAEKSAIQEWMLQNTLPISTIDGVKPSKEPVSISLASLIILYGSIFFLLGCLLAGIIEFQKPSK